MVNADESRVSLSPVLPHAAPPFLFWAVLLIDAAWMLAAGWSFSLERIPRFMVAVCVLLAALAISRYRRDPRIGQTLRAAALLLAFSGAATTLSYLVVSTNAALVDRTLASWDAALGFDWLALHHWLHAHVGWAIALDTAYISGLPQMILIVLFLGLSGRHVQLDEFLRLFMVSSLACILLAGLFPAQGAWKQYGVGDAASLSHFEPLRDGALRTIAFDALQGLVSIPSMHAAMAVLLVYAVRGTALLVPFAALDSVMLASTPVSGGHYLVDVLAGIALAAALIVASRRRRLPGR